MKPRPILEPYHFALIVPLLIGIGLFVATYICPPDTDARTNDSTPAYVLYRAGSWLGYDTDTPPCTMADSLWRDGWRFEELEIEPVQQWTYLLVDRHTDTEWQLFNSDGTWYALRWSTFARGSDGHPHPAGAWVLECEGL